MTDRLTSRTWRLLLLSILVLTVLSNASDGPPCHNQQDIEFICGPINGEDLLWLPDNNHIVVSGMSDEGAGHIYLIEPVSRTYREWFPGHTPAQRWDQSTFDTCPGPLNTHSFSAHGLSLLPGEAQTHRLYVTSHGEREAVEIFEIDASTADPAITWIGCVPIPAHNEINSVAALRGGGFVTTRISGPGPGVDGDFFQGEISGFLYEWHPGGEITRIAGTEMSGPNGIVASADEQSVYVGVWGAAEVVRFVRDQTGQLRRERSIDTGFRVDNLRWTPAGTLLVAGHRLSGRTDCGLPLCLEDWRVAELDAELTEVTTHIVSPSLPGFAAATAALADANGAGYWLGTYLGDRVAFVAGSRQQTN